MADLTAANVTVVLNPEDIDLSPDRVGRRVFPKISFGNGSLTYPALGIPMPALAKLGLFFEIKRAYIEQPSNGFIYHFDRANHKLRIFQGNGGTISGGTFLGDALAAHTHNLKFIAGIAATEPVVIAGGDTLGKNAATDRTIAGADSATKGGVVAASAGTPAGTISGTITIAAGALGELGHVAVAATTLYLELVGR